GVAADDQIEAAGAERELLGVALLEAHRDLALGGLAAGLGDHRGREVDAGHAMAARRELEGEKAGAAADVERVELSARGDDEVEDAIPRGALALCANAVAEVCIEPGRPPVPVGRDLLLDDVGLTGPAGGRGPGRLRSFRPPPV